VKPSERTSFGPCSTPRVSLAVSLDPRHRPGVARALEPRSPCSSRRGGRGQRTPAQAPHHHVSTAPATESPGADNCDGGAGDFHGRNGPPHHQSCIGRRHGLGKSGQHPIPPAPWRNFSPRSSESSPGEVSAVDDLRDERRKGIDRRRLLVAQQALGGFMGPSSVMAPWGHQHFSVHPRIETPGRVGSWTVGSRSRFPYAADPVKIIQLTIWYGGMLPTGVLVPTASERVAVVT
jgi:hypothetical protein